MTCLTPRDSRSSDRPFNSCDPLARPLETVIAIVWLFGLGIGPLSLPAQTVDAAEPASLVELQREIRQTLRKEAQATTLVDRTAAIYELCALHREIVADPRFRSLELLQEMRREVASRLVKVQADLKRRIHRERIEKRPLDPHEELLRSMADHWSLIGSVQGGPAEFWASQRWITGDAVGGAGRGGQGVPDNGQGLVDLIQATIHPGFWDVQGGPGTMIYYSPLRCLVVRATAEVHGDVGGLVQGLRAANP
ncbi:MAG: hypothetical protein U1A77_26360 [Pirellulales bacterium]